MLPLVVQIEKTKEHTADTLAFDKSPVRLGRNPLNDLQLDESFVSQWHAVIRFTGERITYLDLGSTNKTIVNGRAIDRNVEVVIDRDTEVRIGSLRLHIFRAPAPPELFGRRRKSAFAQMGVADEGSVPSTVVLGNSAILSNSPPARSPPARSPPAHSPPAHAPPARSPSPAPSPSPAVSPSSRSPAPSPSPAVSPSSRSPVRTPSLSQTIYGASVTPAARANSSSAPQPRASEHPPGSEQRPRQPHASGAGDIEGAYQHYRDGWREFFAALRAQVEGSPAERRAELALKLQQRFPELAAEPEFRSYLEGLGVDLLRAGQPEMEDWLRRLTEGLFPPTGVRINVAMAMERVGEILEVFSQAFVELRRAQDQFCREMSLERYVEDSLLQRTDDPRALLAYLLTPQREGAGRTIELSRALADFTLHQVGLISAAVEGARKIVEKLAPSALAAATDSAGGPGARGGMLSKLWPGSTRKLWHKYRAQHHALLEDDRFVRELFGREFARRYYAVTGGQAREA